jgi:hypothetical protein
VHTMLGLFLRPVPILSLSPPSPRYPAETILSVSRSLL